jgi:hypothetical protein
LSHDFALDNKQSKAKQRKLVFRVLPWSLAGSLSSVLVAFFWCAFGRLEWNLCAMDNRKTLEIHS